MEIDEEKRKVRKANIGQKAALVSLRFSFPWPFMADSGTHFR